ncbi:MAG: ATP-binding protein [Bacteroidales bacterium]|nr:ATP-binding protein [Bacteroidales bacterium]
MERYAIKELYDWKNRKDRKPLIVQGARQVGKTWLMRKFADEAFAKSVYINFESDARLVHLFEKDFDIQRILLEIQLATGIKPDSETLLIFDEIQEVKRGVTALKYFRENAPEIPVVAAGSLLGIATHRGDSFPVGKVDFMTLYPLSFLEFIEAIGKGRFVDVIRRGDWDLLSSFEADLQSLLRLYYVIGGMPEVVNSFAEEADMQMVRRLQQGILDAYERDFSKHAPADEVPRLRMVWRSISGQLSKENKKFIYGFLKEGARAKNFEIAIEWLKDAGLVYKVNRAKKGQLPLSAYEDFSAFKIFMLDVGLLSTMSDIQPSIILEGNAIFTDYKGALTEQYVFQQLRLSPNNRIYYWSADNSQGEIDFLVQNGNRIFPIEVKAEENLQAKSLKFFVDNNPQLHGVRISMSQYREQSWLTNYPLYAAGTIIS